MSRYLDGEEVRCMDIDGVACDRCGEALVDWRRWQSRDAEEQQQVRRVLDELADGCPVCWDSGRRRGSISTFVGGLSAVRRVGAGYLC